IIALGLREAVPGRAMKNGALVMASVVGLAMPLVAYRLSTTDFSVGPSTWTQWRFGMACFRTSLIWAVPIIVAAAFLTKRAFPTRRVVTGILWGLGCGLIADAGLRLYCEFTTLAHMVLEHFSAVVASMVLGAVITAIGSRGRRRRRFLGGPASPPTNSSQPPHTPSRPPYRARPSHPPLNA